MSREKMMIKVCGMREPANIRAVESLGPSLMGFIFHDGSPRCAAGVDPEVVRNLANGVRPVGVFVNRSADYIDKTCREYGIGIVQLHGDETPGDCRELSRRGYEVMKAIAVTPHIDWEAYRRYEGVVSMFVLDSSSPRRGGSGCKFDWSVLRGYPLSVPYLLGGGIGPDDASLVAATAYPGMAGVDLNSRFEESPGLKNPDILRSFIVSLGKTEENE